MSRYQSDRFPHDRQIRVLRPDMTTYKTLESSHLISVQKMSDSEVRLTQAFRADSTPEDFLVKNPFYNG